MDKSPDAFRTISEVAADLGLPQHVLRFWETKFSQIKPLKRGGGRRYYRPDDVELLKGIRHLLYGEGYTIRGVQRILKEHGVRFVTNVWREGAPQPAGPGARPPRPGAGGAAPSAPREPAFDEAYDEAGYEDEAEEGAGAFEPAPAAEPRPSAAAMAQRFAPRSVEPDRLIGQARAFGEPAAPRAAPRAPEPAEPPRTAPPPGNHHDETPDPAGRSGLGSIIDRFRAPSARGEAEPPAAPPSNPRLGPDEIRRLQATLFELLECKRLLDQAR